MYLIVITMIFENLYFTS